MRQSHKASSSPDGDQAQVIRVYGWPGRGVLVIRISPELPDGFVCLDGQHRLVNLKRERRRPRSGRS